MSNRSTHSNGSAIVFSTSTTPACDVWRRQDEKSCLLAEQTVNPTDNMHTEFFMDRLLREFHLTKEFPSQEGKEEYLSRLSDASNILQSCLPGVPQMKIWSVMRVPYLNKYLRWIVAERDSLGLSYDGHVKTFAEQANQFLREGLLFCTTNHLPGNIRAAAEEFGNTATTAFSKEWTEQQQNWKVSWFAFYIFVLVDADFPDALDSELLEIARCKRFVVPFLNWFAFMTTSMSEDDAILLFFGGDPPHAVELKARAVDAARAALLRAKKEREAKAEAEWLQRRNEQKMKRCKGKALQGEPQSRVERAKEEKADLRAFDLRVAQRRAKVIEALERERRTEQNEMTETTAHEFAQRAVSLGIEQYEKECRAAESAAAHAARLEEHAAAESAKHAAESARRREVRAAAKAAKEAREAREAAEEEARQRARVAAAASRAGASAGSTIAIEDPGASAKAKQKGQREAAIEEARAAYGVRQEAKRQELARAAAVAEEMARNLKIGDSLCWG